MEMKGHRNSSSRQPTLQGEGTSFPGGLALGHLGHFNPFDEYVLGRLRNDKAISALWCGGCFFGETKCRGVVAEASAGAFVELGGHVGDVGG
jgi:hypothetical protein